MPVIAVVVLLAQCAFSGGASRAGEPQVTIKMPEAMSVKTATAVYAIDTAVKSKVVGKIKGRVVTFSGLETDNPYDLTLTLADGTVLAGVNMNWYDDEKAKADAGPLTDDDREALRAIVQDIHDFYNKKEILMLRGDHDRAVTLTLLMRDKDFHAGKGNVIWRVELWYYKFYYGGWEKIPQVNKVLRRERFKSAAEMRAATDKLSWIPELGGIVLTKDRPTVHVDLPAGSTTKP